VGKSTLFNRLIGERRAIVQNEPGTTRDRVYGSTDWNGVDFTIIDTGGLQEETDLPADETELRRLIHRQTRNQANVAIAEADVIVMVADARTGPTPQDIEIAEMLRRANKPVVLAANKAERSDIRFEAYEFYELGLGEPIPISAYHGNGTGDLLDRVVEEVPNADELEEEEVEGPKIAIVGRPNVGKSRLLNALLGQERAIVSDEPGTTRDSLDTVIDWEGQQVTLIDTAGIRRRGRVDEGIERFSVMRSMRAIDRADVVLLVIDATEEFTAQDLHIAGYVEDQKKGMIVIVNKWDLVEKDTYTMDDYRAKAKRQLDFMPYAPVLFISAKTGQRVARVMEGALEVVDERNRRVSTAALNKVLKEAVAKHPPPSKPGKWVRFFYATQADVAPPTFVFFCNEPKMIHFSYRRYIENELREAFGFAGTPLRLSFRSRHETR
jgi:GTP-binding protein